MRRPVFRASPVPLDGLDFRTERLNPFGRIPGEDDNVIPIFDKPTAEEKKLLKDAADALEDWEEQPAEYASELIDELADALQAYAPAGAYFGSHEGDGADFGFWPESGPGSEDYEEE